jgi:formylglycine-generating enzyme required for sulfatase activity
MADMSANGGNGSLRPATGISWNEAARFVNYLNYSYGSPLAYKFATSPGDAGYVANSNITYWSSGTAEYNSQNPARNKLAKFFLPDLDEWYKAAFGGLDGTWYAYPTGSNSAPTPVAGGTSADSAVYNQSGPADTINAGGLSAWGTMGQGGNVWEWVETNNLESEQRILRGGSWSFYNSNLESSLYSAADPSTDYENLGFRIAMIPEPSSFSLLALGGVVAALRRRKR